MRSLVFKSNINCMNCLAKVKPALDHEKEIQKWAVDLQSEDRTLTVETDSLSPDQIKNAILETGFLVEFVRESNE